MSFLLNEIAPDDPMWNKRGALYAPSGEGPTVWAADDIYTVKAASAQTKGNIGFIEATVPAGGGPVPHAHTDEYETFYVL
ncbi:hypothetical protein [Streptomyces sp. NPDC002952]|uniref:hypothetical protein n=1 Tax=Streptomyces sp. NPDC002952 TaxID=3364673 RepID=UPI0036A6D9DE